MKKKLSLKINWKEINLPFLLFLILFLNVKFVVKIIAILFIVIYSKNAKPGLSLKNPRIPLFYSLILLIELVKYFLITRNFSMNYGLVFCMGIFQWVINLLALHQAKLFIEKDSFDKIHNTIKAFFQLNFIVSMFFLALLFFYPAALTFWGHGRDISFSSPSAGDTILGISFDTSTVNATLNGLGLIYFLYKKEYGFALCSILIIVLCTSNVAFLLILSTLCLMLITVKRKKIRLAVLIHVLALTLGYFTISPANREYIRNYLVQLYVVNKNPDLVAKTDSLNIENLSKDSLENKTGDNSIKTKPIKLPDSAYKFNGSRLEKAFANLLTVKSSTNSQTGIPQLQLSDEDFKAKPGKLISFFQTLNFIRSSFKHLCFGAGIGNFSSKLAFRAAGENTQGTYPSKFTYIAPEFKMNHLKTFRFYLGSDVSRHSVLNYPFSVYNQLLGEYGLLGLALFIIFYLGFFIKRYKSLTYGKYLPFILLGFFFMEYWFEMYSLVIFFELLMLLNMKESKTNTASEDKLPDQEQMKLSAMAKT